MRSAAPRAVAVRPAWPTARRHPQLLVAGHAVAPDLRRHQRLQLVGLPELAGGQPLEAARQEGQGSRCRARWPPGCGSGWNVVVTAPIVEPTTAPTRPRVLHAICPYCEDTRVGLCG